MLDPLGEVGGSTGGGTPEGVLREGLYVFGGLPRSRGTKVSIIKGVTSGLVRHKRSCPRPCVIYEL